MMLGVEWTTATDVAAGVLAIAVGYLLRSVVELRDRVSRLEGRLNGVAALESETGLRHRRIDRGGDPS